MTELDEPGVQGSGRKCDLRTLNSAHSFQTVQVLRGREAGSSGGPLVQTHLSSPVAGSVCRVFNRKGESRCFPYRWIPLWRQQVERYTLLSLIFELRERQGREKKDPQLHSYVYWKVMRLANTWELRTRFCYHFLFSFSSSYNIMRIPRATALVMPYLGVLPEPTWVTWLFPSNPQTRHITIVEFIALKYLRVIWRLHGAE